MTTAQIKAQLRITVTDHDADIDFFNPFAQARVNSYVKFELDLDLEAYQGYQPYYARYVWNMIQEGSINADTSGEVKSEAFDGGKMDYADKKDTDLAGTADAALLKFKPLKKRFY